MYKSLILVFLVLFAGEMMAQREYEYYKDNSYMKYYREKPFDCDSIPDRLYSNLTLRICENIKLRESDSILSLYLDSVGTAIRKWEDDTLITEFEFLQTQWRKYRDRHAKLVWQGYEGCGGCHYRSVDYMNTLRRFTDIRIEEMKMLLQLYRKED